MSFKIRDYQSRGFIGIPPTPQKTAENSLLGSENDVLVAITAQENWAAAGNPEFRTFDIRHYMAVMKTLPKVRMDKVANMRHLISQGLDLTDPGDPKLNDVVDRLAADLRKS